MVRRLRLTESAHEEKFENILNMFAGLGYYGNVNIVLADLTNNKRTVGTVKFAGSKYRVDSDTYDEDEILNSTCFGLSQNNSKVIESFYISI